MSSKVVLNLWMNSHSKILAFIEIESVKINLEVWLTLQDINFKINPKKDCILLLNLMYYQSFYIVRCVCNFCMGMWAHYMAVSDFTQGPLGPGSLWEPSAWDPRQNTSSKLVSQPLGSLIRATNLLAYHSMETGLKTLLISYYIFQWIFYQIVNIKLLRWLQVQK